MRVAFLGTSRFAATVLEALGRSEHEVALAVAPPDRRSGRGRRLSPPPVAERAAELGVALHQTESVNGETGAAPILAAEPDLAVVCAFGQLISPPLLGGLELLNVHPSLLPRWRGAAPIERAILAGDARTGVAIMRLVAELDAGPVALVRELEIGRREDFGSLEARLAEAGGELLVAALDQAAAGDLGFTEQPSVGVTYAAKIDRADRLLHPLGASSAELDRRVRALTPHIGAALALAGGDRLGVTRARPVDGRLAAGRLAELDGRLLLGCAEGVLELERVKPAGRGEMAGADLVRGRGVPRLEAG